MRCLLLLLSSASALKINAAAADAQQPQAASEAQEQCAPPAAVLALPDIDVALRSGDALTDTNWHNSAVTMHHQQKMDLAIQHQVMATKAFPYGGPVWDALGKMLLGKIDSLQADHVERLPLLCEAVAALELSAALGHEAALEAVQSTTGYIDGSAACAGMSTAECFTKHCRDPRPIYARARATLLPAIGKPQAQPHSWHLAAPQTGWHRMASTLCRANASDITVHPSSYEVERSVLSAITSFEIYMLWRVCGVVAVGKTFQPDVIEKTRKQVVDVDLTKLMPRIDEYRTRRKVSAQVRSCLTACQAAAAVST